MVEEQSLDANRPTEKPVRLVRPSVVVLCGPAACGKSTFAERHFRPTQVISSDWARGRICDDERDQRFSAQAFELVHFLVEQRLGANRLCVVDSTALTPQARKDLLELARGHGVPCVVLLFDVPLEKCVERDQGRERTVGRPVIERQYQFFERAKASLRQEGFDQVIELGDEDLGRARIEIIFRPVPRPAPTAARGAVRVAQPGPARPPFMRQPRAAQPARSSGLPPPPAQPGAQPPTSTSGGGAAPAGGAEASALTAPPPSAAPAVAPRQPEPSSPPAPPEPSSHEPPGQ